MAFPDDIPMGPEQVLTILGEVFDHVSVSMAWDRDSHPHNSSSNPKFKRSKPGRRGFTLTYRGWADRTQKPIETLQIMADNSDYVDIRCEPWGSGHGGYRNETFEHTSLKFDGDAAGGGQVMVELVGHTSGDIVPI